MARHGFAEALQACQVLHRLGFGDKAALALDAEDQALFL